MSGRSITLKGSMGEAVYSPCERYRYALTRELGGDDAPVMFVMLNPSTATQDNNDPTVTRAIGFANRVGASRLTVCNVFGYRSTDPKGLRTVDDPTGSGNTRVIMARARACGAIIVAWGNHAGASGFAMARRLARTHEVLCLGVTKMGQPKHPLYLRADEPLREYAHDYAEVQASQSP